MTDDIAKIARGLTSEEARACIMMTADFQAGPGLPDCVLDHVLALRTAGLVEREFADEGPPQASIGDHEMTVRLSACWHFRLTPLGIQVRDYLKEMTDDQ